MTLRLPEEKRTTSFEGTFTGADYTDILNTLYANRAHLVMDVRFQFEEVN